LPRLKFGECTSGRYAAQDGQIKGRLPPSPRRRFAKDKPCQGARGTQDDRRQQETQSVSSRRGSVNQFLAVGADYSDNLGRTGSSAEIAGWVAAFEAGLTNEDLIAAFVASDEYFADHS
jgi:hypothetical protein